MASNLSFFDTSNNIVDILAGVNQATNNGFGVAILVIIGILIFIIFQNYGIKRVLMLEGFIMTIISTLLVAAGWISFLYIMLPVLLLFLGVILQIFAKEY